MERFGDWIATHLLIPLVYALWTHDPRRSSGIPKNSYQDAFYAPPIAPAMPDFISIARA